MNISYLLKDAIDNRIEEVKDFAHTYELDEFDQEELDSTLDDLEAISTALEIPGCNINTIQRELSCDYGNYFTAKPNAKRLEDITGLQSIELEAEGHQYDVCYMKSIEELEDEA